MPCLTLHSKKKLLISLLSTLHSHFSLSCRRSLLPTHHHPETFLASVGDKIVKTLKGPVGCRLCRRGFVGCAVARDELVEALAFLADVGFWVVPWVCDLSLYFNQSAMDL